MKIFYKISVVTALIVSLVLGFTGPITVHAATTPSLGTAASYGILSSTFTRNIGLTAITGDLGYTTLSGSGTHSVTGATNIPSPAQAGTDAGTALADLNGQSCTSLGTNVLLAGTYTPGCYSSSGTMDIALSTTVTLSGAGTYIFRSGGAITTGANSIVVLANGASSCDVFWTPNGGTTLGANSTFIGTVIPVSQAITVGNLASWRGRALTYGSTVTTDTATINSTCTTAAVIPPGGGSNRGTITLVKTVINDSSGIKTVVDFPLFVNGTQFISGVTYPFPAPAVYTVTETTDSNYTRTFSGDCDINGRIELNVNENKFCIVTNNDIGVPLVPPVPPIIALVKVPSPLSLPAGPGLVTYTYTLRNIGTVPVTNITIVGDTCSPIVLVSGDTNGDSKLDVNETWVHRCSWTLSETHTNTAVATGWANGISATDIASSTVVVGLPVVPPLIHVTKVPSPLTLLTGGGMVTYTKKVTNPGTIALSNVRLTDDKCASVAYISGDTNGDSKLDTTETWTYTCQTNLTQTTVNTVTASGDANGLTARDFAIATVVVAVPKLPSTGIGPEGKSILWDIVVMAGIFAALTFFYFIRRKQTI